jgi:hypothetical protein
LEITVDNLKNNLFGGVSHRPPDPQDDLANDLLRGVPAISRFTGETPRQTYYALTAGLLPGFKRGKIWFARKSSLRRR